MSDFNCDCSPTYPNGVATPIPPFWGFSAFTPTIPKLYWNVKSQEQRILNLFDLLNKLVCYADNMGLHIDVNAQDITDLQEEIQNLKDGGLLDYYTAQIYQWVQDNMPELMGAAVKQVYFGLTDDGRFCAYVPESWSDITFDTGMVYGRSDYGRLLLRFNVDSTSVTDNTYSYTAANLTSTLARDIESCYRALFTDLDQLTLGQED